jgi:hypothetical protein
VIKNSDVFPEREEQVTNVIDKLVRQACGMWRITTKPTDCSVMLWLYMMY